MVYLVVTTWDLRVMKEKDNAHGDNKGRAKKLINWLRVIYPVMKVTQSDNDLSVWESAIKDLSDEELRTACRWCKNNNEQFPPSVSRFRFKAKGLVDTTLALMYAEKDPYYHPAIKEARRIIGENTWRRSNKDFIRKSFICTYAVVCDKILNGIDITVKEKETNKVIDKKKQTEKPSSGAAIKHLKEIKEILANAKNKWRNDGKI